MTDDAKLRQVLDQAGFFDDEKMQLLDPSSYFELLTRTLSCFDHGCDSLDTEQIFLLACTCPQHIANKLDTAVLQWLQEQPSKIRFIITCALFRGLCSKGDRKFNMEVFNILEQVAGSISQSLFVSDEYILLLCEVYNNDAMQDGAVKQQLYSTLESRVNDIQNMPLARYLAELLAK